MPERRAAANLHQTLDEMTELLQHHRALEALAGRQARPSAVSSNSCNAVKTRWSCSGECRRCIRPIWRSCWSRCRTPIGC